MCSGMIFHRRCPLRETNIEIWGAGRRGIGEEYFLSTVRGAASSPDPKHLNLTDMPQDASHGSACGHSRVALARFPLETLAYDK